MMTMKKTIIITGSSSGIGYETAKYFAEKGWNVIATMRHPEKRENRFQGKNNIEMCHLDVLDQKSINDCIEYVVKKYGSVDVFLNNAGYAVVGPFEDLSKEQIEQQFDTNLFGIFETTRGIIPIFRKQKKGLIINLSSMGGRIGFPAYSIYNSTKWALEGFSESLRYELEPFGIRIKLVEPGVVKTDFYGRSMVKAESSEDYRKFTERVMKNMEKASVEMLPIEVAKVIYQAATDGSNKLRYPVGSDAKMLTTMRKILPSSTFEYFFRSRLVK